MNKKCNNGYLYLNFKEFEEFLQNKQQEFELLETCWEYKFSFWNGGYCFNLNAKFKNKETGELIEECFKFNVDNELLLGIQNDNFKTLINKYKPIIFEFYLPILEKLNRKSFIYKYEQKSFDWREEDGFSFKITKDNVFEVFNIAEVKKANDDVFIKKMSNAKLYDTFYIGHIVKFKNDNIIDVVCENEELKADIIKYLNEAEDYE
ncbi:hypothetical protein [[Clostridium] colinum]|uniref:hypothetical protein n=1 Tax=[Clostridium] colinum TaxID=36835 RepID=UPI002023D000|nr:hypothetical protein [[Clostridium] colinum]